jgi:hypothetical protein
MPNTLDRHVRRFAKGVPSKLLLDTYGAFRVYVVDGEQIRNSSLAGQEFGESASHFTLPLVVPDGEVWIEDDVSLDERPFVIAGALRIAQTHDYASGVCFEKHEREKAKLAGTEWPGEWLSSDCYVRQVGMLPNGVAVFLVDGEKVRDETKTDFIEGGHDLVYPWLPPKTIVIEAGSHANEQPFILDHEGTERRRMANGMGYAKAHHFAAKEEFAARQHGAPSWCIELMAIGQCLERSKTAGDGDAARTVYASAGPGVQQDVSPAGQLAMAFEYCHTARITGLPVAYDEITGPVVVEPGVRISYARRGQTLDQQPASVQFDSEKFSEDQARAWLNAHNIREYTFLPDVRDKAPVTQGSPRDEGEKPPEGFSDIGSFYSATLPIETETENTQ